jgi:hypothetical protein
MQKSPWFADYLTTQTERYKRSLKENGEEHVATLLAQRDVAQVLMWMGRFEDAEPYLWQVLEQLNQAEDDNAILQYTISLMHTIDRSLGREKTVINRPVSERAE